jgi:hypothetical protein
MTTNNEAGVNRAFDQLSEGIASLVKIRAMSLIAASLRSGLDGDVEGAIAQARIDVAESLEGFAARLRGTKREEAPTNG